MGQRQPLNILFIFADEMRWDCMGAVGNPLIRTPNLDRLAADGLLFRNAWSTAPLCVPARSQVLTGLSCWNSGSWGLSDPLPPPTRTFAHALGERGYFTAGVGKMHFCPCNSAAWLREPHGFGELVLSEEVLSEDNQPDDDYTQYLVRHGYGHLGRYVHGYRSPDHSEMGYQAQVSDLPLKHFDTTWTGDETIAMLERHADAPFLIWSSFVKPHFPCELPSDWPCPYDPDEIPLRASYTPEPDPDGEEFNLMAGSIRGALNAGWLEEKTLREFAAYYYGNITLIDAQVGRILDTLERLGLRDSTLVVFSADHGECLGERGQFGKAVYFDESARVPMILSGPPVAAPGTVDERHVILEDLFPTFLQAGGAAIPEGLAGESILPLLSDRDRPGRDAVFGVLGGAYHFEPREAQCFVRCGEWKYMYQFAGGCEKLFNVEQDPVELNDVSKLPENRAACDEMNRRIARWFSEGGARFLTIDGRLRRDLRH